MAEALTHVGIVGVDVEGSTTQYTDFNWYIGTYWNVNDGKATASDNYVSTPFFACSSLEEFETKVTNANTILTNNDTTMFIILRLEGSFAGNYYNGKFHRGKTEVPSVTFDEVAIDIAINHYPSYTDFKLITKTPSVEGTSYSFDAETFNSAVNNSNKISNKYYGKKCALFGDSITYWDNRTSWYDSSVTVIGYPTYMRNELGVLIDNFGVAGAQMSSICNTLKSKNLALYDCVILTGGTNDANNDISVTTYRNSVVSALQYAYESNPYIKIFLVTPPQLHHNDKNVIPYCDALAEIGETYGVPCLRLDQEMQINEFNQSTLTVEGIHPNNDGYKLYADVLIPFLLNH